jgi:hypothetical protein
MQTLYQTGCTREALDSMLTFRDFNDLIGLDEVRKIESSYYETIF